MSTEIRLGDYTTTPLYNIKAVVQATSISPSTLRAWERRYNVCQPQRSESGYRLYSDQDIAIIRWLKTQVDSGMAISQAVLWYETLVAESGQLNNVVLPGGSEPPSTYSADQQMVSPRDSVRPPQVLQSKVLNALLDFDEVTAEQLFEEALALYSVEQIGEHLITPVLREVGERWHDGTLSATREHYVTNFLRQRLFAILRILPQSTHSPLIWVTCAPGEFHEVGPLLLALYLRRAGHQVHYLGQNLAEEGFIEEIQREQPAMVLFSASTADPVPRLADLTMALAQLPQPRPIIGYGGQIFISTPEYRNNIAGVFLGESAQESVDMVAHLLAANS